MAAAPVATIELKKNGDASSSSRPLSTVPEVPKGSVDLGFGQIMVRRLQLPGFHTVTFRNLTRGIVRTYDLAKTSVLHGSTFTRGDKFVLEFSGESGTRTLTIDADWKPRKLGSRGQLTLAQLPHSETVTPPARPMGADVSQVQRRFGMAPGKPWFDNLPKV